MSDLVCLNCGKEMEYEWAPCSNCGWKPPDPWETTNEEYEETIVQKPILGKPNLWVQITVWAILIASWGWLIYFIEQVFKK